mmetsp:Transcript_30265/g.44742  ORF Transcript_30265/g.44742 Transcript_30265/m.44742 type:complete len:81 (+) Transcript_30265:288-530(+)
MEYPYLDDSQDRDHAVWHQRGRLCYSQGAFRYADKIGNPLPQIRCGRSESANARNENVVKLDPFMVVVLLALIFPKEIHQ